MAVLLCCRIIYVYKLPCAEANSVQTVAFPYKHVLKEGLFKNKLVRSTSSKAHT